MEIQMQELLEQIKKQGVEVAEAEAAAILSGAKSEAEEIVSAAKREAEELLRAAKAETERLTRVSEDAIRQAGRNLLLSFRESVNRELNALLLASVKVTYTPEALSAVILKAVEAWAKNADAADLTVLLTQDDLENLEATLLAALKNSLAAGVTLKPSDGFTDGFRIALNTEGIYYDYSATAVAELLSDYLNPRVAALLKEAAQA